MTPFNLISIGLCARCIDDVSGVVSLSLDAISSTLATDASSNCVCWFENEHLLLLRDTLPRSRQSSPFGLSPAW